MITLRQSHHEIINWSYFNSILKKSTFGRNLYRVSGTEPHLRYRFIPELLFLEYSKRGSCGFKWVVTNQIPEDPCPKQHARLHRVSRIWDCILDINTSIMGITAISTISISDDYTTLPRYAQYVETGKGDYWNPLEI